MGLFIDRNALSLTMVMINIEDPRVSTMLPCAKTAQKLFEHFVERTNSIQRLVYYLGEQPSGTGPNVVQLQLQFSDKADVASLAAGMPLEWLDCSTHFFNITPNTASGTIYLRMALLARGLVPRAIQTGQCLLI